MGKEIKVVDVLLPQVFTSVGNSSKLYVYVFGGAGFFFFSYRSTYFQWA